MSSQMEPLALIVKLSADRGGMHLPIVGPSFSIGRDVTNNLCVMDDQAVSRQHCIIHVVGSSLMIEDTSRNGTFIDGERVLGVAPLPIPSTIRLGRDTAFEILPNEPDEENVTSVIDTSMIQDMGSMIVPRTGMLRMSTDAYLVVDIVDSTSLVRTNGSMFAKLTLAMGRTLERSMKNEPRPFLKSTGDGFFACFGTAPAALRAGIDLVPTLARQMTFNARISVALHWGPSTLTDRGDRIGNNVHAVFSVEQIRHQDSALEQEMRDRGTGELILMTEAFWERLDEDDRPRARLLGTYPLKGFEEPVRIYRWHGTPG